MPEILFLTNEQSLLEVIDQLKALVDARTLIINDFSQGLKEIFFRQPAVVFMQKEIGGITGEKVASQVRALLDDEPIRLVLFQNEPNECQGANTNFNGIIDISLPPPELIRQLQQQINNVLFKEQGMPAVAGETLQNDTTMFEFSIDPPKPVDLFTIDSLADVFPAQLPNDWGAPLPYDKQDAQTAPEIIEPINPGEEFTFDTIPEIPPENPAGNINSPLFTETGLHH
jgi:hypothetical protein